VLCRPYSAGILHSFSEQMQNLPNYFTTPNKMTSENDIKGLVSLKFLPPWLDLSATSVQIPRVSARKLEKLIFHPEKRQFSVITLLFSDKKL
jgi:hypothetical protein